MAVRISANAQFLSRTANLPAVSGFTICGWFQRVNTGDGSWESVCALDASSSQYYILYCRHQNAAGATESTFGVWTGNTVGNHNGIVTITNGAWYFFALVSTGTGAGQADAYAAAVGDANLSNDSQPGQSFTPTQLSIGRNNGFTNEWANGRWAAVKVYDAALTTDELQQERWYYTPQRTANLNMWTPMIDNTAATAAIDYGGNGRNWTVNSTPTIEDGPPITWDQTKRLFLLKTTSSGGITGSLARTFGVLTSSAAATLGISGSLARTYGSLTLDADGALSITGAGNRTLGAVTSTAAAALAISGALAKTLGVLTLVSAGSGVVSGSLSATLGALTTTVKSATLAITGSLAKTLGVLTSTSTATLSITGALSRTLGVLTSIATGGSGLQGSLSRTLGTLTVTAGTAVLAITGSLSRTLGSLGRTATGTLGITGALNKTLGILTVFGRDLAPTSTFRSKARRFFSYLWRK